MKRTVFYEEHLKLGAKMTEFGGWEMPLNYTAGIIAEHLATRKFGGLFDISHMGRFCISGPDALPFMQYVLTNNAAALATGQSQYTLIPNENGGAIDDAYLYRVSENEYWLVVNAANSEKDWAWLQEHTRNFPGLKLEDISTRIAMLSLQGPVTQGVLEDTLGESGRIPGPKKNSMTTTEISGKHVVISRTGYAGEPVGFELFPPADIALQLFKKLLEYGKAAGIVPVGLGARDTLRLEACLPLYGHELGTGNEGKEIPVFALPAARFAVSFSHTKGYFIGRKALHRQFAEINLRQQDKLHLPEKELLVPRTIFALALCGAGIARPGYPVYFGDCFAGNVTSGTAVPYWKFEGQGIELKPGRQSQNRAICLAYLNSGLSEGMRLSVLVRDKKIDAITVSRHLISSMPPYAIPELIEKQACRLS